MDTWEYDAEDYRAVADWIEQADAAACHPDLFQVRSEVAITLRALAAAPTLAHHRRYLDTVRFYYYTSRSRSVTRVK